VKQEGIVVYALAAIHNKPYGDARNALEFHHIALLVVAGLMPGSHFTGWNLGQALFTNLHGCTLLVCAFTLDMEGILVRL